MFVKPKCYSNLKHLIRILLHVVVKARKLKAKTKIIQRRRHTSVLSEKTYIILEYRNKNSDALKKKKWKPILTVMLIICKDCVFVREKSVSLIL